MRYIFGLCRPTAGRSAIVLHSKYALMNDRPFVGKCQLSALLKVN